MAIGLLALLFAAYLYMRVLAFDPGTPEMQQVAGAIREGAMAFLKRQYRTLVVFAVLLALILAGVGFLKMKFENSPAHGGCFFRGSLGLRARRLHRHAGGDQEQCPDGARS